MSHGAGPWPSSSWCTVNVLDWKKEERSEGVKEGEKVIKEEGGPKNGERRKYINFLNPSLQNTFKKNSVL